jgi:hypothetical protein
VLALLSIDLLRHAIGYGGALVVAGLVAWWARLWVKGATVLFYVRFETDVRSDGSAFTARRECANGHPMEDWDLFCPICGTGIGREESPRIAEDS